MIIKIDDEKIIQYDQTTEKVEVFSIKQIETEALEAQEKLKTIPVAPTDKELLAWAKKNYPEVDYSKEVEFLNSKINFAESVKTSFETINIKKWQ